MITNIKQNDLIQSIADAFQFISYYHPKDFITAMNKAYKLEKSYRAKDAIAQILTNSRMCAEGHRPICQDTGIATVFLKIGMNIRWIDATMDITSMINEGVRLAYLNPNNILRASILNNPSSKRNNTGDNTPAVVHYEVVPGNTIEIICTAKGAGSENKAKMVMLNPTDSILDWVISVVETMGAGWCPPGILGIGIGGTAEKAMIMAKESLMDSIDIQEIITRGPKTYIEQLRIQIYEKINRLGIGAQGLGGLTTVLDVKIKEYPTHAASLPVAIIPNCAATRHVHFSLDGNGPVKLEIPSLSDWSDIIWKTNSKRSKFVNLDTLTAEEVNNWKPGEILLLNGKLLTGRDAAHKRIEDMLSKGEKLPVDFKNRVIYYVGPVNPVHGEVIGPAGPTTATRMDRFTEMMLSKTGLISMIGKGERSSIAISAIKKYKAAYLIAIGGAGYLVSKAIKTSRIVCFGDLGMEAIYEFYVENMPVTVAVNSAGISIHEIGPKEWKNQKIKDLQKIPKIIHL